MHEPGDKIIVADNGLAVAPGLHTLFDIDYTVVSTRKTHCWPAFDKLENKIKVIVSSCFSR